MLSEFFSRLRSQAAGPENRLTNDMTGTSSWAEGIALELKGLISQAVLAELEAREGKYLRSILDKSQFFVESLVVIPLDKETSRSFESFLEVHSEVEPGFKLEFFRSLMERQYRSTRGALASVGLDFLPSVQFLQGSLEQPSDDEVYQVSLRGRRLRFKVQACLRGPVARGTLEPTAPSLSERAVAQSAVESGVGAEKSELTLRIWDADGEREVSVTSPCVIGREAPSDGELGGVSFVALSGHYVSRRHLVVVSVFEETYFFLHEAASLTCLSSGGELLHRSKVYSIPKQSALALLFGASGTPGEQVFDRSKASEFPVVEIRRKGVTAPVMSQATPRPRAVR